MAREYLEQLTALVARTAPSLPSGSALEVKHFFGGAAAYVDGRIFMSLSKVGLALKLPEEDREQLFRTRQAKRLRYFPKAPIKKQYALFPKKFLNDSESVRMRIESSIGFVISDKPGEDA